MKVSQNCYFFYNYFELRKKLVIHHISTWTNMNMNPQNPFHLMTQIQWRNLSVSHHHHRKHPAASNFRGGRLLGSCIHIIVAGELKFHVCVWVVVFFLSGKAKITSKTTSADYATFAQETSSSPLSFCFSCCFALVKSSRRRQRRRSVSSFARPRAGELFMSQ